MIAWFKKNYHWVIALIMLLEVSVYGGIANNFASIYMIPVTESMGMSRADFSITVSFRAMAILLGTAFSGIVFQRLGVRKAVVLGLTVSGLSYWLLAKTSTVLAMSVVCITIGLGDSLLGNAAVARVTDAWFHRYRGTVLGLITASTGLGGAIYSVVLTNIIQQYTWQTARRFAAICLFCVAIPIVFLLRNRPHEMGLKPYGEGYVPKKKKHRNENDHWEGCSAKELMRKPIFYLAAVSFFLAGFCCYLAFSNVAAHFQDGGMTATEAASLFSALMILLAVFKFLYGALCDLIGAKLVSCISIFTLAMGLWLMATVTTTEKAIFSVLLYSMGLPVMNIIPLVTYPLFGYSSHDATLGIFISMPNLGCLLAVPLANAIYDRAGSYTPVMYFAAVLSLVVLGLYILLYYLAKRAQKDLTEKQNTKI